MRTGISFNKIRLLILEVEDVGSKRLFGRLRFLFGDITLFLLPLLDPSLILLLFLLLLHFLDHFGLANLLFLVVLLMEGVRFR